MRRSAAIDDADQGRDRVRTPLERLPVQFEEDALESRIRQAGLLAPVVGWLTAARTRRFVQMEVRGLKHRCENLGVIADAAS